MPNRLGKAEGGGTSAKACRESRNGSATVQPAPRRTARRERGSTSFLVNRDMRLVHLSRRNLRLTLRGRRRPHIPELWAQHNGLDHRVKSIPLSRQIRLHAIQQRLIGKLQRPVQPVRQQFAAQVVDVLLLAMVADKSAQS